ARKVELPSERRDSCPEERARQKAAWDAVLERVPGSGTSLRLRSRMNPIEPVLAAALERLNEDMALPRPVHVRVAECDEPNAYYEMGPDTILICSELTPHIRARRPQ
ncbi:MAG: DUF4344 domain-containing metallopeptidase, partial [Pseudomonadota bacterium]